MASQFASIAPIPFPAPRSVRIAYSAGTAATAVQDKIADLPAHIRDATLEELSVIGLADQVVAQAGDLLSPRMFAAFLEWAEAATLAETNNSGDDDATGDEIDRLHAALRRIGRVSSINEHDVGLKTYIAMIEYGDCPSFGPVIKAPVSEPGAQLGLIDDLLYMSPLLNPLNQLAATAWSFSPRSAYAPGIGAAIAAQFAKARRGERVSPSSATPNPWNELATAYLAAKVVEDDYDRKFCSIDESLPTGAERSAAVQAIPRAHWDESQRLGEYRLGLEEQLLREPASTPAVFAMKVLICRGEGHSDDMDQYDAMLAEDARALVDAVIAAADLPRRSAFTATLERYQSFRKAYEVHYKDVLCPAHDRYEEATKQWPTGYDYASDPIAHSARDAAGYDAIEDHSDELVSAYVDAMLELLVMPAPDVAGLAIKLEILKKEEGSTLTRIDEIVDQLAADARAIAGGVSPLEVQ